MKSPIELVYGNLAYERAVISNPAAYTYGAVEAAAKTILARMDLFEKIITEKEMLTAAPKQPSAIDALQAIANLPTGRTEEVMEGHEDAYRAIENLFDTPPYIEGGRTPPAPEQHVVGEDEIVEAMVQSLRNPFPLTNLSISGGIDRWREIMRTAYRAAIVASPSPSTRAGE